MEPVEDIPQDAILNALPWNWESYGEYLDAITELFKKSGRSDESWRQPDFGHFRLLGGDICKRGTQTQPDTQPVLPILNDWLNPPRAYGPSLTPCRMISTYCFLFA